MHQATIHIQPVGAAHIGFAQATGLPGDIRVNFRGQDNLPYAGIAALYPQLVLRPFTALAGHGYDIDIDDESEASGLATIPGPVMNDRFAVEVYTRNSIGQPQRMIACGRIDLTGYAYRSLGPLGPASYPVGPSGPAGAAGPPGPAGVRGSRWYTGVGEPSLGAAGRVEGDMWLDEATGNVWRWDTATMSWLGYVRA